MAWSLENYELYHMSDIWVLVTLNALAITVSIKFLEMKTRCCSNVGSPVSLFLKRAKLFGINTKGCIMCCHVGLDWDTTQ